MRKCIACCKNTVGTGWPGLSLSEIDFLYNQGLCNLLHWRVGPFSSKNEPEWEWTGGGAYEEDVVTGKVDLTRFNQPYFDAITNAVIYAGERKMNIEISSLGGDSWSLKTRCYRSNALPGEPCAWMPWTPQGNIQGEDHVKTAYRGTKPDAVQRAFEDKILETTCHFDNVVYEIGTESDQLVGNDGRTPKDVVDYELTMEARIRQYEEAHGCKRHLVGTNFVVPTDAIYAWLQKGRLDYINVHRFDASAIPYTAGFWGPDDIKRPLVTDEINPTPPMAPEEVQAFACYSRANGSYYAAWRHDQDDNPWKATLSLIAQDSINGCSEKMKSGCPYDVPAVSRVDCKRHSGNVWDCTPKSSRGPILPEGKITRALCEQVATGLKPGEGVIWSVTPKSGGTISVSSAPNRWQARLAGTPGATGTLHCKLPKINDACGQVVTVQ